MDSWGISTGFLAIQLFNLALLCGWPVFSLVTLFSLKNRHLTGITQAVWALIVIAIPFLGALAFWILQPAGDAK